MRPKKVPGPLKKVTTPTTHGPFADFESLMSVDTGGGVPGGGGGGGPLYIPAGTPGVKDGMFRFPSGSFAESELNAAVNASPFNLSTTNNSICHTAAVMLSEFSNDMHNIRDRYDLDPQPESQKLSRLPQCTKDDLLQELWAKCSRLLQDFERLKATTPSNMVTEPRSILSTPLATPARAFNATTAFSDYASPILKQQPPASQRVGVVRPTLSHPPSARPSLTPSVVPTPVPSLNPITPIIIPSSVASIAYPMPTFESHNAHFDVDEAGNETLNQYSIIGELGRGAFATVDLAEHAVTSELVAIKAIKRSLIKKLGRGGPDKMARVMTEIAIMKKLHHRNVVQLYEVIDDPNADRLFLVLQYIERGPIASVTESGTCAPIPSDRLAKYFRQAVTGLQYLHHHNIIHRDIKPDNILLDSRDNVYLSDFGVSSCFDDEESMKRTEGTPSYFSPEICRGEGHLHPEASDVWALGITLYLLSFGFLPFGLGCCGSVVSMLDAVQNAPLTFPEGAELQLVQLLKGLLNRDPMRRLTLSEIKNHPWLLAHVEGHVIAAPVGALPAHPVVPSAEEVQNALRRCDSSRVTFKRSGITVTASTAHRSASIKKHVAKGRAREIVSRYVAALRQRLQRSTLFSNPAGRTPQRPGPGSARHRNTTYPSMPDSGINGIENATPKMPAVPARQSKAFRVRTPEPLATVE